MRLADQLTLNFNHDMSTAAVLLDIEKAFDKILHSGLIYRLSELDFLTSLIKLITSFLTDKKFKIFVVTNFLCEEK
jgi:hypothetical protein